MPYITLNLQVDMKRFMELSAMRVVFEEKHKLQYQGAYEGYIHLLAEMNAILWKLCPITKSESHRRHAGTETSPKTTIVYKDSL